MEWIVEYVNVIALLICAIIGYLVKNCINNVKLNQFIPVLVSIIGVVITVWIVGEFTPVTLLTGLLSGLASTGAYELIKNLIDTIPVLFKR